MNRQLSTRFSPAWLGVCLALGLAAAAYGQVLDSFFDVFTEVSSDDSYTHYDPVSSVTGSDSGTWTVANGAYRLYAFPSRNPSLLGPARLGSLVTGLTVRDFSAGIDLLAWDSDRNAAVVGLAARVANIGLGTTTGYAVVWDEGSDDLTLLRLTGEQESAVVASQAIVLDPAKTYRLELTAAGQSFMGLLDDLAQPGTPLAVLSGTDAAYDAGLIGPFIFDNSAKGDGYVTATFDNFQVVPEPGFFALMAGLGLAGFALARRWAGKRSWQRAFPSQSRP